MDAVFVKATLDGRKVEVIDGWICLDGQRESPALVAIDEHPNRQAILRAVPGASHVAGRLPLTLAEASVAGAALRRHQDRFDGSPLAVAERMRQVSWQRAQAEGVE
jgi:hypothetical protein